MRAYLYQGPKNQVSKCGDPISLEDCDALFAEAIASGADVVRTNRTITAQCGDMIAFAVIGSSQGDYSRAAEAAGYFSI